MSLLRIRSLALPSLVVAILMALAGIVLFCFDPERCGFYPICIFHQSTGLLCPGCGSLRAMHQLLHGHLWRGPAPQRPVRFGLAARGLALPRDASFAE